MANLRNRKEFREELIKALGITEDRDLENEYNFKRALLDGMGVSYITEDITNFDRYRAKILEGVRNGGGGGGSSDFSTAQVTITNTGTETIYIKIPYVDPNGGGITMGEYGLGSNATETVTAVMYKGRAYIDAGGRITSLSGAIEYAIEGSTRYAIVSGDGTMTVRSAFA